MLSKTSNQSPKKTGTQAAGQRKRVSATGTPAKSTVGYVSPDDLLRHIHEGIKPYQKLADQSGLSFLAYLLEMAVEESQPAPKKRRKKT